jgi:hypothetical protein
LSIVFTGTCSASVTCHVMDPLATLFMTSTG